MSAGGKPTKTPQSAANTTTTTTGKQPDTSPGGPTQPKHKPKHILTSINPSTIPNHSQTTNTTTIQRTRNLPVSAPVSQTDYHDFLDSRTTEKDIPAGSSDGVVGTSSSAGSLDHHHHHHHLRRRRSSSNNRRTRNSPLVRRCLDSLALFSPTHLTVSIDAQRRSPHAPMTPLLLHPPASSPLPPRPSKSRWFSIEFAIYWAVLAYSLLLIISTAVALSHVDHPNYHLYQHKLSKGWIFNRKIDNSDLQYRRFRQGLTKLGLLSLGYLSLSKLSRRWLGPGGRKDFQTLAAALILLLLHGSSVLIILAILILNFQVSRISIPTSPSSRFQKAAATGLVWFVNLAVLFANDYWNGYAFKNLASSLEFLDRPQYKGLIPRWQIGFNISLLRLISYALDYQWAVQNHFQNLPRSSAAGEPENEKERAKSNRVSADYGFQNYFNYVLYPPLYIAGPIITFNNFMSQMNKKPSTITRRTIAGYTARFGVCYLTLEWILHYMYVVAIKDTQGWAGDTPFELGIIGYWNLIIIWLKLLIPWRFFRLWALLDGVDPPENMIRCMSNNFSTLEFWRSWHRSYNLWIVRYLYIPLGGAANMVPATVVVFTFVALWHDLSFKLLTWGWLVSLFVLPEVLAKQTFAKSSYRARHWFRHLVALGGTLNVMTMMSANLVGFSIGIDGVKFMWHELLGSWAGVRVLAAILGVVFCAVQVMIEYREAEMREGILRKC
ncbi:glycerol transporter [Puccinia graminis f. sp. tritici]|uniref:Glycerol transporter n=2 Tax=Puccinia graminis f. sp. tritici TaxID=56615 RepID=A0A5B0NZ31_PUCGR|nr:glycerol transporter [Puccinia graminis f. sp. tritici]